MVNTDKIVIVGDFNIHVDTQDDNLNSGFNAILHSIGFTQINHNPTHYYYYYVILVLVLTESIE